MNFYNTTTSVHNVDSFSEIELANNKGQYTNKNGVNDMTLICVKYDDDKIIIHADSLVTQKSGNKFYDKIFFQNDKPIIIAYSGFSEVNSAGQLIYVDKIIKHSISNFNGENYESIKNTLTHDIGRFLPRDVDSFGQIIIGALIDKKLRLEKIEIVAKAKTNIYNYSIFSIENSESYYFNKENIVVSGIINHNEVINKYKYLAGSQEDKLHQIMQYYIKDTSYYNIGGYELSVTLNLDGQIIVKKYE